MRTRSNQKMSSARFCSTGSSQRHRVRYLHLAIALHSLSQIANLCIEPPQQVPCAITAYPAKFRDPSTNLPYCNAYAYKEIQRLKRGEYRWSTLLQAYVGQSQYAARGVPPRFIKPTGPAPESRTRPLQTARR